MVLKLIPDIFTLSNDTSGSLNIVLNDAHEVKVISSVKIVKIKTFFFISVLFIEDYNP